MTRIALMGAGGKMGCRITDQLKDKSGFQVAHVETGPEGIKRLASRGITATPQEDALKGAQVVILAVPDRLIGRISSDIVPRLGPGCRVIGLDPAAAYAGIMPDRKDITYFVTHPCHPPLFFGDNDPAAQKDWFGGVGRQDIVCALYLGPEDHYTECESLARIMYAPVRDSYRITVEQMAILEPALVETFSSSLIAAMKEALDEAVRMGVPEKAARAFFMGHARVQFGVIFGYADFEFSDGAKLAMKKAEKFIFQPDWKKNIMNIAKIRESVADITESVKR